MKVEIGALKMADYLDLKESMINHTKPGVLIGRNITFKNLLIFFLPVRFVLRWMARL